MGVDFQTAINRNIRPRQWSDIARLWLSYLPSISPVGTMPSDGVEDYVPFRLVASTITPEKPAHAKVYQHDIRGLRELVFHEAICLLHKSSHVLSCAEVTAMSGRQTWSLAMAYQAGYFAAKVIAYLMGIALPQYNGGKSTVLIDMWPNAAAMRSVTASGINANMNMNFSHYRPRLQHLPLWQLLKLLIQICSVGVWPSEFVAALNLIAETDFEEQRNRLHYGSTTWIYSDLHTPMKAYPTFGMPRPADPNFLVYSLSSDFTMNMSVVLFRMAYLLVADVAGLTNKLDAEFNLLNRGLTEKNLHPIYVESFP